MNFEIITEIPFSEEPGLNFVDLQNERICIQRENENSQVEGYQLLSFAGTPLSEVYTYILMPPEASYLVSKNDEIGVINHHGDELLLEEGDYFVEHKGFWGGLGIYNFYTKKGIITSDGQIILNSRYTLLNRIDIAHFVLFNPQKRVLQILKIKL